jgi:hypothetical protein
MAKKEPVMKIFSSLHKTSEAQNSAETKILQARPKNLDECIQLAKEVSSYSQWKDPHAEAVWKHIVGACQIFDLDIRQVVESELANGDSVLENCIQAQDWPSCLVVCRALPDGLYCNNRVHRYGNALVLNEEGVLKQKGLLEFRDGCYYAGSLQRGLPHGEGMDKLDGDNVFEGNFINNQKQGWGVYRNKKTGKVTREGNFKDDYFVGSAKPQSKTRLSGLLSCLRHP